MEMNEMGKRLRQTRLSKGMTQGDLAKKASVSKQAISNYENGRDPTLQVFFRLADALGVSADWAFGRKCSLRIDTLADVLRAVLTIEEKLGVTIQADFPEPLNDILNALRTVLRDKKTCCLYDTVFSGAMVVLEDYKLSNGGEET